jgi:RNA polymerase sigma factor (sigma-70 family)
MEKYLNLIRKIAWSFHKSTGIDWDDLFSEAVDCYFKALEHYDPKKSAITTFMYQYITNGLINYVNKQKEINEPLTSIDVEDFYYLPFHNPTPFWESLTKDAQRIAELIYKYSQYFVCLDSEQAEQRVIQIMTHSKLGWSKERTLAGLKDLKQACK